MPAIGALRAVDRHNNVWSVKGAFHIHPNALAVMQKGLT
jgi:hypothetical protein